MMALMERFGNYWIFYYAFFLAVLAVLLAQYPAALNWRHESGLLLLAAVFGVSAGAALTFTICVEVLGRMVLLIPAAARKLRAEGKAEGIKEANQRWRDYLERKAAAEQAGLPFNEPPPA